MVSHKKKGPRSKTRQKFRKHKRERGKPTPTAMLRAFKIGDLVHIAANPAVHSAMPFRRFQGKTGTVVGKRGGCYLVSIKDIRAEKEIIIHPAHLKLQVMK